MNITVAIMAHPKRKGRAIELANQLLRYPFQDVSTIYDRDDAHTHEDEWNNGKRALLAGVDRGCEWHCVLQDDALLTPDFYTNLNQCIFSVPSKSLISLYTGKPRPLGKRVEQAVNKVTSESWLQYWLLMWGVGIVIPTNHIQPMIDFVDDRKEPYDTRIGIFYQRNRLPIYYTMPSLVNHDDDLDSLLDHGKAKGARVAHRPAKGLVSWNSRVINI